MEKDSSSSSSSSSSTTPPASDTGRAVAERVNPNLPGDERGKGQIVGGQFRKGRAGSTRPPDIDTDTWKYFLDSRERKRFA